MIKALKKEFAMLLMSQASPSLAVGFYSSMGSRYVWDMFPQPIGNDLG
jgi:predicted MFS family arabinose efflux permease